MKRGLTLLVLCILLIPMAFALHSASLSTSYIPVYETNPVNLTITVTNGYLPFIGINEVDFVTDIFTIIDVLPSFGWTIINNNSINFFTDSMGIGSGAAQPFRFAVYPPNVDQNTAANWTITTTDTGNDSEINNLQLMIYNDDTAPIITPLSPAQYLLGNSTTLFSIDADDPETGIAAAELYLSNCDLVYDNETNTSAMQYSQNVLFCTDNICESVEDLSIESEGDICYYYDVSNYGGELANSGDIISIIDRTSPIINLIAPNNGEFFNTTSVNLEFTAADNYDALLDCIITVGNSTYNTTSSGNTAYNLPISDGYYQWFVTCSDEVNLLGVSETRTFVVDNQGPVITINAPLTDRGNDVIIDVTITDASSGVNQSSITAEIVDTNGTAIPVTIINDQIIYPTDISTTTGDYTVTVTASDNIGFVTTETQTFRIREGYTITLTITPNQIDASTSNNTLYADLTGSIVKDDATIPTGTIDIIWIVQNETLDIDNQTGNFAAQIEIPQIEGGYPITAVFTTAADIYTAVAVVTVGPYCGNGITDPGEECDITTTAVCSDYGYSQGSTSCTASCTIDISACSNPSPPSGGGGSGGGGSNVIMLAQEPELILQEDNLVSGLIEVPEEEVVVKEEAESTADDEIIAPEEPGGIGIGIGASWAVFTKLGKGAAVKALLVLALISGLLYVFGWKKKTDEWDRYFNRHGHR